MKRHIALLSAALVGRLVAQDPGTGPFVLNDGVLRDSTVYAMEVLHSMPGISLYAAGPRYRIGDDPAYADRAMNDTAWAVWEDPFAMYHGPVGTYWLRFHLDVDPKMKAPVVIALTGHGTLEAYHNGKLIIRSGQWDDPEAEGIYNTRSSALLPVARDGRPEVIALRLRKTSDDALLSDAWTLMADLHAADVEEHIRRLGTRSRLEFGFFGGVNALILLLAAVIWWRDRRGRSWGLLALFALFTFVVTIVFTLPKVDLGITIGTVNLVLLLGEFVYPLSVYLLVLVMRDLFATLDRRSVIGFGMLALLMIAAKITPVAEYVEQLYVSLIFFLEVARQSVRAVHRGHYAGWIIAVGGLVFIVFGVMLDNYYAFARVDMPLGQRSLMRFSYYVAMPVAVAVYLAIRSAQHARLVARQRDDLDREVQERTAELRAERDRSEELLLNILPEEVAQELKTKGEAEARHFDEATILFTDFKGFTQASERMTPQELVAELNTCFKSFDHIITARGIEKIKTIGDAYMCVGGLPDPKSSSPVDVVHAALEMQAFMLARKAERDLQGTPAFEMRVGIHSGPVVAGIVGVKKFQYDIWGDTVNTASRMESSGEVGQVNISEATYELVKNETGLTFTPRGKVQAKGKGEMEMYFVERA
ncbi:MAG: hypothetical protein KA791_14820 [Flavobacteriales bacterium]|nr:hypothetical protein [Flavobacteriales bacterium]